MLALMTTPLLLLLLGSSLSYASPCGTGAELVIMCSLDSPRLQLGLNKIRKEMELDCIKTRNSSLLKQANE